MVQPLWKAVWRFLRKLKIDLPYDPAIALLGIYPRDTGVLMHRGTCTPMFIKCGFLKTKRTKSTTRPINAENKLTAATRNGNPLALLVGMQIGAATLENSVEVPQKIKNRSTL